MPNLCLFDMRVKGNTRDALKLFEWLSARYEYGTDASLKCYTIKDGERCYGEIDEKNKIASEHHIGYRVFECERIDRGENDYISLYGDCAWSV